LSYDMMFIGLLSAIMFDKKIFYRKI
jgi:hypothetical protein